jgi:hypothetical protein
MAVLVIEPFVEQGPKSFAAIQFEKLRPDDKASLAGVRDGRWKTGPSWVGHCIRLGLWPRLAGVPTTLEEVRRPRACRYTCRRSVAAVLA